MIRGIPPQTMADVSRARGLWSARRWSASGVNRASGKATRPKGENVGIRPVKKPREWRYQTRPSFKRVRGPLVDVFNEAEEVLIVVDLGGFTRGEISLSMNPEHYILQATRGDQQFQEIIDLPANVDVERSQERLLNGVLEIVLPRSVSEKSEHAPSRPASPAKMPVIRGNTARAARLLGARGTLLGRAPRRTVKKKKR